MTGLWPSCVYSEVGIYRRAVEDFAQYELQAPGWLQVQKAGRPWFLAQIQAGNLKPRDIGIWFLAVGSAATTNGDVRFSAVELSRQLGYAQTGDVVHSLGRLQRAGAIQRISLGRYMVSPFLMRAGGPKRHRQWFARWAELQQERQAKDSLPAAA